MLKQTLLKQLIGQFVTNKQKLIFNMVFGKVFEGDKSISLLFAITGMQHLLSASAYNVTVFLECFSPIITKLKTKKARFCLTLGLMLGFFCLSDQSISIKRALLMRLFYLLSGFFQAQYNMLRSLLLFALLAVIFNQQILASIGFQLSGLAVLALYLKSYSSPIKEDLESSTTQKQSKSLLAIIQNFYHNELLPSFLINLFLAPLLLFYFGQFSLLSIVLTPMLFWLIPLLTKSGLLLFLIFIFKSLFTGSLVFFWPVVELADCLVNVLLYCLQLASHCAHWQLQVSNLPFLALLAYYLVLFLVFSKQRQCHLRRFHFSCIDYLSLA